MSSGDETYLESFIESISTFPFDIRRNLELLRDLDRSFSATNEELQKTQEEYIHRAEQTIWNLPFPPNDSDHGSDEKNEYIDIPTTEELRSYIEHPQMESQMDDLQKHSEQYAQEKLKVAEQTYHIVDAAVKRLDKDLKHFEDLLKTSGEFQSVSAGLAKPNDLAAIQVNPNSADWIFAKVISHDAETGMYKLSDEDVESNKIFHLPEPQVVVLGEMDRLQRGDIIYAVYPDTTSFYQATVVQAPRKVSGGGSFVLVNFQDDSDENGVTHDKPVLLKHAMRVPYGTNVT